jgi:RNA polymerase sigma-70 factor (ECF subfamily)
VTTPYLRWKSDPGTELAGGEVGRLRGTANPFNTPRISGVVSMASMISRVPTEPIVPEGAPFSTRSDDELMVISAAGVTVAFAVLVARHEARVRAYCGRFCRNRAIGDDVAQECFLRLWQVRAGYAPSGQFTSFLLRIAENRCKNELRGRARRPEVLGVATEAPASSADQLDELLAARRQQAVHDGLAKLPDVQRRAILLRFAGGLDYEQIAAIVGRPEPTVRSRVFHGIARLRRLLAKGIVT